MSVSSTERIATVTGWQRWLLSSHESDTSGLESPRHVALWLMAIVLAFMPSLTRTAFAQQEQAALVQGIWTITSMDGRPLPEEPPVTLTIAGTTYQQARGGAVNERGTIRLDTSRTPMTVDFFITDGTAAGTTQLGVIEASSDTVRISLGYPGANQRPADFTVTDRVIVLILKKTMP